MSSLTKRVLTGSILALLIIAATLLLPGTGFALLLAAFVIVGAWEWSGMVGWSAPRQRLAYSAGFVLALLGAAWLIQDEGGTWALLLAGLVWWLVALAWVVRAQQGLIVDVLKFPLVRVFAGWLILAPAWGALVTLHARSDSGSFMVLYLLLLISTADIAAFFVGRRFGRRRLASNISPGKSLEGAAGGLTAVAVLSIVVSLMADFTAPVGFIVLSLVTAVVSILGDLTESVFKRRAGLKDSGSIIPGHGGILDRIDSVTAAAPIFVLGCIWQDSVL